MGDQAGDHGRMETAELGKTWELCCGGGVLGVLMVMAVS